MAENFTGRPSVCTCADNGMLDHGHHVAGLGLRMRMHLLHGQHRPAGTPAFSSSASHSAVVRRWKWE